MDKFSRRNFLTKGAIGLAVLSGGVPVLRSAALPTEVNGDESQVIALLEQDNVSALTQPENWNPTEDNALGPFHRKGAPYRAKVSAPMSEGAVLVIRGRVWGYDTKKPLKNARIDIWQADHGGHYDNDGSSKTPPILASKNRARVITDENGYYELETIHPGPYQTSPGVWRPSHIHYLVRHPGYEDLITQLYFSGDAHQDTDSIIKQSLIIDLEQVNADNGTYETGVFDIVLEPSG